VLLVVRVLGERRAAGGAMAWLLAIVLVPWLGVPFYLVFGGRKLNQKIRAKGLLYDAGEDSHFDAETLMTGGPGMVGPGMPPPQSGNRVDLHFSGETAYARLMRMFEEARETIHVTTFILGHDEVGRAVIDTLARRAREGVQVRLLLDGLGCIRTSRRFSDPLREAGGQVGRFMPVLPLQRKWSANLRNHRKIVVVDHVSAMVGGMNLATDFMGPTPRDNRFLDSAVFVEGPIVADIESVFRSDWNYATEERLDPPPHAHSIARQRTADDALAVSTLQIVASGPDVPEDTFPDTLLSEVMESRERIWLITPYFVPDDALLRALAVKARAGRDVRIIVPLHSNHRIADFARGPALRDLVTAGVHVYAYPKGMIHAKAMIFDRRLAITGTPNLDMRSLYLNFEVAMFHYTRPEVEKVAAWAAWLQAQSVHLTGKKPAPFRDWAEHLCQIFAPLL
jgi:cardiolipin synthase